MILNQKIQLKKVIQRSALMLALLAGNFLASAQGPGDPGDPNPDAGVPLEGADILLIAMGVAFVFYKVWQHNRKTKTATT